MSHSTTGGFPDQPDGPAARWVQVHGLCQAGRASDDKHRCDRPSHRAARFRRVSGHGSKCPGMSVRALVCNYDSDAAIDFRGDWTVSGTIAISGWGRTADAREWWS